MPDFITLTCPSCGGKLKITNDIQRFACVYCGTEHIVKRGEGVISLAPVVEGLKNVQIGVDKTASELAINRLKEEIAEVEGELHSKENSQSTNSNRVTFYGIAICVVGGMLACGMIPFLRDNYQDLICPFWFGLILLIIGILVLILRFRSEKAFEQRKKAETEPLIKLWQQKQRELKHHLDIVGK
jgi:F0F1-type ATP synthase assembly protein I